MHLYFFTFISTPSPDSSYFTHTLTHTEILPDTGGLGGSYGYSPAFKCASETPGLMLWLLYNYSWQRGGRHWEGIKAIAALWLLSMNTLNTYSRSVDGPAWALRPLFWFSTVIWLNCISGLLRSKSVSSLSPVGKIKNIWRRWTTCSGNIMRCSTSEPIFNYEMTMYYAKTQKHVLLWNQLWSLLHSLFIILTRCSV